MEQVDEPYSGFVADTERYCVRVFLLSCPLTYKERFEAAGAAAAKKGFFSHFHSAVVAGVEDNGVKDRWKEAWKQNLEAEARASMAEIMGHERRDLRDIHVTIRDEERDGKGCQYERKELRSSWQHGGNLHTGAPGIFTVNASPKEFNAWVTHGVLPYAAMNS